MNDLLSALRPIMSRPMRATTVNLPDDAPVRLSIDSPNGYARNITLGELRQIWEAYENAQAIESHPIPTIGSPGDQMHLVGVEMTTYEPAVIAPRRFKIILRFHRGESEDFAAALVLAEIQTLETVTQTVSDFLTTLKPQ